MPHKEDKPKGSGPYHAYFLRGINGSDSILETPFPQIAFVGRSNVGKSSTLNAILGVNDLARISATPGKTQQINFFMVRDNMFFVDLPGYGYAKMPPKESESIRKHIVWYLSGGEAKPTLVVLILDIRHEPSEHDRELLSLAAGEGHPLLVLLNKVDKLSGNERTERLKAFSREYPDVEFVPFSAKDRTNVDLVRKKIFKQ